MHPRVPAIMEFHQPRFWGLDPVFSARVKLNVIDALSLQKYPGFSEVYCIINHPISTIHVMGDIVSISKKNRLIVYEVDDGTGVISCCQWRKSEDSDEGLFIPALGQLVSVFGRLSEFREEKQLKVSTIVPEEDPNAEPLHWLQTIHLKRTIYSQPFVLPPGITSSSVDDENTVAVRTLIHEVVIQYLQELFANSKKNFTLTELKCDKELERRCYCAVKDGSGDQVPQVLRSIVADLPAEGVVIPVKLALKTLSGETVYEVFSASKHLFPTIMDYINTKMKTPNGERLGVPEKWIVQNMKQKEVFSQLPTHFITSALEHLVEQSQIFPVGHKTYKSIM